MKLPPDHFRFCPACGTAGFIENDRGEVLLIKRGKNPAKGKLAPPGGFADYGESAEEALSREVREETGIEITRWSYLASAVNWYTYKEVTYPVLDFFYSAKAAADVSLDLCTEETNGARWIHKDSIDADALAFPSMQAAFKVFMSGI